MKHYSKYGLSSTGNINVYNVVSLLSWPSWRLEINLLDHLLEELGWRVSHRANGL